MTLTFLALQLVFYHFPIALYASAIGCIHGFIKELINQVSSSEQAISGFALPFSNLL